MQQFSYTYKDESTDALCEHFTEDLYNRYRIVLGSGESLVITPGVSGALLVIWIQVPEPEGKTYPREFIQALGEGLEDWQLY